MSKISKETATVQDGGPAVDYFGDLDDYTVDFVTIREAHSLVELLKGLPGIRLVQSQLCDQSGPCRRQEDSGTRSS